MVRFLNGEFVEDGRKAAVSPDDRGFLFGDGAYEVVAFYGGRPFGMEAHFKRFHRSLSELRIDPPDPAELKRLAPEMVRRNGMEGQDCLFYVQCTRGVAPRTHYFPDPSVPPTLYASVSEFNRPIEPGEKGVSISLFPDIRWLRCDVKSINLLPNVLARQQAREAGSEEGVFVRDGVVTEGTHSNLFAVFPDRLSTHPSNQLILSGITRATVLKICSEMGLAVEERAITRRELFDAREVFLAGTTVEIMPVVEIGGRQVDRGRPGEITGRIRRAYLETVGAV
ncbi:D-amino-acid transaminase [Candidatus Fermentibacteria bacterium]|nr:D-amino-acid transaminase [Candidatus Fermentibacteria bacterium]